MIVTISYGVDNAPETLENVVSIEEIPTYGGNGSGVSIRYISKNGDSLVRNIRYTNYVTITIH